MPRKTERIGVRTLRRLALPAVDGGGDKEGRGSALVIGGAREMPGAVLLAAVGALRAGAGKLQMATARSVAGGLAIAVPEARVGGLAETRSGAIRGASAGEAARRARGADAVLVGPGMLEPREVERFVVGLVGRLARADEPPALVLDAAAIAVLARRGSLLHALDGRAVITPHLGEMAALRGLSKEAVRTDPLRVARETAASLRAVVALKGAETFVVTPDGRALRNVAGNVGLATSGSGDTLAGVVTGLLARGADPFVAAVWGVHAHACAGDALAARFAPLGFLARELLDEIPCELARLSGGGRRPGR